MKYGYGYKRDRHDPRDHMLSARLGLAPPPPRAGVWSRASNVKDQLQSSSCVGQSVSQAVRLAWLHDGVQCPELSALDVYEEARRLEGVTADEGTEIRFAIRAVERLGVCDETVWPMSMARVQMPLTPSAVRQGFDRRGIRGYYRIASGDVDGIKRAIAHGFPVVGGWDLTQSFEDWHPAEGPIDAQEGEIIGGHAMALHTYDGDVFEGVNSWGVDWGLKGHWRATRAFVAQATDVWAIDVRGPS